MAAVVCMNNLFHDGRWRTSTRICQRNIQRRLMVKIKRCSNMNISRISSCSTPQEHFSCLLDLKAIMSAVFGGYSEVEDEEVSFPKKWWQTHVMAIAGLLMSVSLVVVPSSYAAVDAFEAYSCLMKGCSLELAKCIANPSCAANIACLETCNGRPDEAECEMRCGDLFQNRVVEEFNQCAISRAKCIPRITDVGEFPVPDPSVLVKDFNISDFTGKWYITSGLNPTFDIYDCQLQEFNVESGKLVGDMSWRIQTPDGCFFTRSEVQRFVQDPLHPGILYNQDNHYLHYQDNWYILSSKIENQDDDYVFVYYRGSNDAWDGYGGAVVYTRSAVLPESMIPEFEKAAKSVGREFSKFIKTDNTCKPKPSIVERIEKTVEAGEKAIVKGLEQRLARLARVK